MAARRSSMTICARCGRCSAHAHVSAHGLSAGGDLPVRSVGAARAGPGRSRPDASRLGRGRCLGYSRAGAGALIFSKEAPDMLWGMGRCLWRLGALPRDAGVGSRGRASTPAAAARPTRSPASAGSCGVGWYLCEPADPQAKGAVERLQGYHGDATSSPAGASRTSSTSSCSSTAGSTRPTARHPQDAARPADRPARPRSAR